MKNDKLFSMRTGGFGKFEKSKTPGPEAFLGPPPPSDMPELISNWVTGEPWIATGYGIRFKAGRGLTEQEMMDMEITYSESPETVQRNMEFPRLAPDEEAAEAFKAISGLLAPSKDDPPTPDIDKLISGFSASLGEVIREYAPRHAAAIAAGNGEFVAGPKLGPALRAFSVLFEKTVRIDGEERDLPADEGKGAFFIAPNRAIDLRTVFDRAAFRTVMMGETVPRALAVTMFEVRHSLDERLAGVRVSAQESWDAMMTEPDAFFLSPDREAVSRIGSEVIQDRKPKPEPTPAREEPEVDEVDPNDLWDESDNADYDDDDPRSFGL